MSLQIIEYNPTTSSFISLESLSFYNVFSTFKAFKEFSTLSNSKELKEFQDILPILSFLTYYKDFKLLLCSTCSISINPSYFKGHFTKHSLGFKGKEKERFVLKAISILETLDITSPPLSQELILTFSSQHTLFPLKELPLLKNLFQCSLCSIIKSNNKNIKRHIQEHRRELEEVENQDLSLSYRVIAKGQSLERNKYFFKVEEKGKGRLIEVEGEEEEEEEEEGGRATLSPIPSLFQEESKESSLPNLQIEENPYLEASSLFIRDFNLKREKLEKKMSIYSLSQEEPLTSFQKKTRYIQFLNKKNLRSLSSLGSPIKEDEELLFILSLNLKELLYLSLEKSSYISNIHLKHLNSFQKGVVRNKPLIPLLRANSRIKYFSFFSTFLAFIFRSFFNTSYKKDNLYSLSREAISLLEDLKDLASLEANEALEKEIDLTKKYKQTKKSLSRKLNLFKINTFIKEGRMIEEEDLEEGEEEEDLRSNPSLSSLDSSTSSISIEEEDSSSLSSSSSTRIESTSITLLERIKEIGEANSSPISKKIKEKLLSLLILLAKEEVDLNIFSSPINSFFAIKSISSNLSFRGTQYLSQYYSYFIYSYQLLVLEFSIQEAICYNNPSLILSSIQEFMSSFFHNTSSSALAEILNNRSYALATNINLSSFSNIIIHSAQEDTLTYSKVTISKLELIKVFHKAIFQANKLLREKLLFNIPFEEYLKDLTLESLSKDEDLLNSTPYKCFKDFNSNSTLYNAFLRDKVFSTLPLFRKFFNISSEKNLSLKRTTLSAYIRDIKEFLRFCLLLVHFSSGLPLRGTELCTLRFLNSTKDKRELILDSATSLFILNISYKKNYNSQGSNIRYLPRSVSTIFLYYITLVIPFLDFLIISDTPSTSYLSLRPYFFIVNKHFLSSRDLSIKISTFTNLILGKKLNIQVYRHIILGMIKNFMNEDLDEVSLALREENEEEGFSNIISLQMNHSRQTEELHYARSISTFSNVKGSLQTRYLLFCLRYFQFFQLDSISLDSDLFTSSLQIENKVNKDSIDFFNNSPALRFKRTLPIDYS